MTEANDDRDTGICDEGRVDPNGDANDPEAAEARTDGREYLDPSVTPELEASLGQMVPRLCAACRAITRLRLVKNAHLAVHHPTISSLHKSVDFGCPLCTDLARSLEVFAKGKRLTLDDSFYITCTVSKFPRGPHVHRFTRVWLRFALVRSDHEASSSSSNELIEYFQVLDFVKATKLRLGSDFFDPNLVTTHSDSPTSIGLMKGWLSRCLNCHETCRSWRLEHRTLPTRLIQVWTSDASSKVRARLYETDGLSSETRYVTLSHRWGDSINFKLNEENFDILHQEIPLDELPPTLKDAIRVTAQLNVTFIWIDSLCIIQDQPNQEDWARESRRMGDIYRYADCNLAAAGAGDTASGLFHERKASQFSYMPFYLRFDSSRDRAGGGFYVHLPNGEFNTNITRNDLNSRAWVAQERTLSPGIIHFTPGDIWWECNELVANESTPEGGVAWVRHGHRPGVIRDLQQKTREEVYQFWGDFLAIYANTHLTFEKDRFPAMTGIAKFVGKILKDNLVAGFWEGDLAASLVWSVRKVSGIPSVPPAPSWSCMSLQGSLWNIGYSRISYQPLDGIVIEPTSDVPDFKSDLQRIPFEKSAVKALAVHGPLRRCPDEVAAKSQYGPDEKEKLFGHIRFEVYFDDKTLGAVFGDNVPEDKAWRFDNPTHFLPLTEDIFSQSIIGILLQRVPEAEFYNTFRRLGRVELRCHSEENLKEQLGLSTKDGKYQSSPLFEECGLQDFLLV